MMENRVLDQAGCFENTPPDPIHIADLKMVTVRKG
jgi:hypothetical protein